MIDAFDEVVADTVKFIEALDARVGELPMDALKDSIVEAMVDYRDYATKKTTDKNNVEYARRYFALKYLLGEYQRRRSC